MLLKVRNRQLVKKEPFPFRGVTAPSAVTPLKADPKDKEEAEADAAAIRQATPQVKTAAPVKKAEVKQKAPAQK